MDEDERSRLVIDNLDSTDITKHLLKTFVSLTGVKPDECDTDDQHWMFVFLSRFGWTSFTLWSQFFPEPNYKLQPKDSKGVILDVPGASLITRSLYENFLAAFHLVGDAVGEEQKQCRRLIWDWHAAKLRCGFTEYFESGPDIADQVNKEFHEIDKQLRNDPVFMVLTSRVRKKVLESNSGLSHSNTKIAQAAGVDLNFHKTLYGSLSSHAHCDSHSFRLYIEGDHKFMMDCLRMQFLQISSLILDLTRNFLLADRIQNDFVLNEIIKYGLIMVRDFSKHRNPDEDGGLDRRGDVRT